MTCYRKSNVLSVTLFVAVIVFAILDASATDYYIDSVGGDDSAAGTATNTAWKSHAKAQSTSLAAGDVVHFKCGSAFSGPIEITESGTAANPIRLTSYGTGEAPKFTNPSNSTTQMHGNCIRLGSSGGGGDYIIVENLHFHDTLGDPTTTASYVMTTIGALRIRKGADHCIIRNNTFTKCLQGIMSAGEHTLITGNYMDCGSNAPSLWRTADSSWGPMGIHINIGNHEISHNTIKNYGTSDSPWGSDGGAIEIDNGNYHKTNIYIHHNYSEGNAGFIESSWDYDWPQYKQEVKDWRVSFNVCYDGQSWLFMLAPCTGVYFDNNTIARYNSFGRSQDWGARMDVQGGTPVGVASGAHFRNNLFVYTSEPYQGNRAAGALKTKNWYCRKDQPSTVYAGDSNQAGSGDPKIVSLGNGNYNLTAGSSLRGAGVNLSATYPNAVDFNGQALPASGSWDIGAMQYTAAPTLSINDVTVTEGNSGTVNATFAVTLSAASSETVTVSYATVDTTAVQPADYTQVTATTLTFNPGETSKNVTVAVKGDAIYEANETLYMNLSSAVNATITDAAGVCTITDDDASSDNDGDGASNYEEHLADTDPTNALSRFHIDSITKNTTGFTISFASSASRRYTLYYSTNLTSGSWMNIPTQTDIPGSGGVDTLTDPSPTGTQRFYRVGVSLP
jgi:hypothetical protein